MGKKKRGLHRAEAVEAEGGSRETVKAKDHQATAGFRLLEVRCFALVESKDLNHYYLRTPFP
jgi:hypothetical protein